MTILRPGKKRRDPLGGHTCAFCDCEFVLQHADPLPLANSRGEMWMHCPECHALVELNPMMPRTTP